MSQNRLNLLEEDSRSFDGKTVDVDEEDFFSFRNEGTLSPHQTWSTFEDLDDSGHFTASPDGERTVSNGGSSPSHSPCPTSAHLLLQMQHHDSNLNSQFHLDLSKPLISPRSIMTVKVPHTNSTISFPPNENNLKNLQTSLSSGFMLKSNVAENEAGDNNNDSIDNVTTQKSSMHIEEEVVPTSKCESSHSSIKYGEESSEYLRSILENFNSLYMEKLRMIDDLVTEGNDEQKKILMEKKTIMLENWAKDVCVQNMVLVHTVEELEREANRKVSALQHKITESTQLAKEHMTMIKKYEQQVKLLLKNHSDTEEKNLVLKIDLEKLKSECRRIRERMNSLLKDNESLVTLMCRIRDMGVWDVSGLELQRSSFDQIFGLYPSLVGSEVQTVFTRQKARHVKDTEDRILKLEQELANLEKTRKETEVCILQKDRKIEELETEIKNVSNKVQYSEQECNDYKRSLLETQEKLLEATRQLNAAPKIAKPSSAGVNEMGELLRELREVKSQLNMAVEEKQTAREESNYFKKELSDRLKEMHDIQNVFQSLAAEVVNSRAVFQQVQEKEVQLQSLKSEIHTYQSKCTDADDTIRKKETEIINLQKQMNKIHKKRKKRSYMSSSSSSSEKPGSTMLSFYNANLRNVSSPSKIPVRKTNPQIRSSSVKETNKSVNRSSDQGSSQRPPWNTHFKKSIGIISTPAAALPLVPKSSPSKESRSTVRRITTKSQVFELEDEWEKVFSNLDHSADGRDAKKMDKASSPIKTNGESGVLPDPESSMDLNSSTEQSQPSSDEEPIQELLNRLALEKQEMEERYRKELQDRDIEIRMQKTPYALIDNFTVAAPKVDSAQPCNCDNCLNQRSILDLVRRFENRKLHMISELGELKSENSELENKVSSLEPRLTTVTNKLNSGADLRKKTILQHNSIPLDSSHSKLSSRHLSNIAKNLQPCSGHIQRTGNFHIAQGRQLEDDKYLLQKDSAVIDRHPLNEREALKKSFQVDVQQIENVLHDKQNLEYQLKEVWDCNNFMVDKIQELEKLVKEMEKDKVENEEQLIASHMKLPSVKNDNPVLDSFSPMNRLEAIKGAFDTNEKIIFTQNQQLTEKVVLLSNYEMYINSMWNCVAQLIPRQELEDPDVKMLDKLEHLCECVKQALIDNGLLCKKLEALQHRLVVANSENAVLNETVAALNDNIEALARQNDKLLQQFHNRNKDSGPLNLSNLSSPRSTLSEEVEKEGSSLLAVDMNASGDFCPSRRKRFSPQVSPTSATLVPVPLKNYDICPCSFSFCSQCRKSESPTQASSHIPPPLLADDDIKEYRENLKLMQKRLLDLDKASRGILAVSLPLFNDPNLCLSSDNSGSITTQQIDGFGEIGDASAIHIGEGRCIQTTDLAQTLKLETNSRS